MLEIIAKRLVGAASGGRRVCIGLFLVVCAVSPCAAASPVIDRAWREFGFDVMVESFGVFWIAAEVAILFCMGVAVRFFAERPAPQHLRLTPRERRWLGLCCVIVGTLALFVYGRHAVIAPLPMALEAIGDAGGDVIQPARDTYLARAELHALLWCAFVTAWILLEIAIVAQGIRAFGNLLGLVSESRRAG